jgi:ornithine cyclodeaminase/alanine dehydrogenase-like protein (mu-crystallin family)
VDLNKTVGWEPEQQSCHAHSEIMGPEAESETMTLHISEAEVRAVLTMPLAVEAVEEISRKQATGEVVVHPRRRFELPVGGFFHYMAAADFSLGFVAMKQYTYVRGKLRFLVPLYEMATGELLALIEADYMGQLRTGAASGVATKYLGRKVLASRQSLAPGGRPGHSLKRLPWFAS